MGRGAIHEAVGRSCRDGFEVQGGMPLEVRAAGPLASAAPTRTILPALLGVPVRLLRRPAPAATGAAMAALSATGALASLANAGGRWVEPYLSAPLRPDRALVDVYR